jgi:hypothetical protein
LSDVRKCQKNVRKHWTSGIRKCWKMSESIGHQASGSVGKCQKVSEIVRKCQMSESVGSVRKHQKVSESVRKCQKALDVRECQKTPEPDMGQ